MAKRLRSIPPVIPHYPPDNDRGAYAPQLWYGDEAVNAADGPWYDAPPGSIYVQGGTTTGGLYSKVADTGTAGDWQALAASGSSTGVYNVRDYGATGDGTTDDTAAIQAALDACTGATGLTQPGGDATASDRGGIVYLPAGVYLITARLLITKSNTRLIGAGPELSVIQCQSAITEMLRIKYCSACEVSNLTLNGGTGQIGANATAATTGLYLDLVDYCTFRNLTIKFTKLYGIVACRLWESFFSNLVIHSTGWFASGATPSAAIWFTTDDSETYPALVPAATGSNNTTFIKPTLCPYGTIVRVTAQNTANLHFHNLIYEQYPATNTTDAFNEDRILIDGIVFHIYFDGGVMSLHKFADQAGAGAAFNISENANGVLIKDFSVWNDGVAGEHAALTTIIKNRSGFPVTVDNLWIYDPYRRFGSYFDLNDIWLVGGNVYIDNQSLGGTDDLSAYFATGAVDTTKFHLDLYVRNTGNYRLYAWKLNRLRGRNAAASGDAVIAGDDLILVDTSAGDVLIDAFASYMPNRHVTIKKRTGDANYLRVGLNGSDADGDPTTLAIAEPYGGVHLYSDGTDFWILNRNIVRQSDLRLTKYQETISSSRAVDVAQKSFILLDNTSGANTITLSAPSSEDGHILVLYANIGGGSLTLADSGTCHLSAAWTPTDTSTLTLIAYGTLWFEIARSTNA